MEKEVGYIMGRGAACCRAYRQTETNSYSHLHSYLQFRITTKPNPIHVFGLREEGVPEENRHGEHSSH